MMPPSPKPTTAGIVDLDGIHEGGGIRRHGGIRPFADDIGPVTYPATFRHIHRKVRLQRARLETPPLCPHGCTVEQNKGRASSASLVVGVDAIRVDVACEAVVVTTRSATGERQSEQRYRALTHPSSGPRESPPDARSCGAYLRFPH